MLLPRALCDAPDTLPARLALAHEMAHLRRGDLWLGWVPALANALFFFHPLVWLAGREYLQARGEACDAAAVRLTGAPPDEYGRLLLRFGVADAPADGSGRLRNGSLVPGSCAAVCSCSVT